MDDGIDWKAYRRLLKVHRQEYMEENDCELATTSSFPKDCCGRAIHKFQADTHEAWIMQCPKGMSLDALEGKRIKMPGRRYISGMQVRGVKYAEPQPNAIGYVTAKGKYAMRMIPVSGYVVASKRLNTHKPKELTPDVFPVAAKPQKPKLPVRHPFFGRNYKSHVELPEKISENVREAVKKNYDTAKKLRRTANFYKIRSRLLATAQMLDEKENEVRQSVLTGIVPQFMQQDEHPDYLGLYGDKDDSPEIKQELAETDEERPVKRRKKRHGESALADSVSVHVKQERVSPARESKKKHRKSMPEQQADREKSKKQRHSEIKLETGHVMPQIKTEKSDENVIPENDDSSFAVPELEASSKKSKKHRKHRHTEDEQETQMNGHTNVIPSIKPEQSDDDVVVVKVELPSEDETSKKKKKSKKRRHDSEMNYEEMNDKCRSSVPDIKLEMHDLTASEANGSATKRRKKHKADK